MTELMVPCSAISFYVKGALRSLPGRHPSPGRSLWSRDNCPPAGDGAQLLSSLLWRSKALPGSAPRRKWLVLFSPPNRLLVGAELPALFLLQERISCTRPLLAFPSSLSPPRSLLQPHRPPRCFSNMPAMVLPQGLCTGCARPRPLSLHGSLPDFIWVSPPVSFPW